MERNVRRINGEITHLHDVKDDKDKTVRVQSGLRNPIRWLDNETIVYRVKTDLESADYAMSLTGGERDTIFESEMDGFLRCQSQGLDDELDTLE